MKALIKQSSDPFDIVLKEIPKPVPNENDVVIKVVYAGLCGTDLKIYEGGYHNYKVPLVLGHELSGQIDAVGSNVNKLKVGDNVVTRTITSSCKKCNLCIQGSENLCREKKRLGFNIDGAFAQYVRVPSEIIHTLPDNIDLITASLMEPLTVAVHSLRNVMIKPSDVVLIIGPGPIGLMTLLLSKLYNASVIMTGLNADINRLKTGKEMGADAFVIADDEKITEKQLFEMTNGQGFDIVFECSGSEAAVNQGLKFCRRGGRYVQIGTRSEPILTDFMKIAYKEIHVNGGIGHTINDWHNAIKLLAEKKIDFSVFMNNIYSLEYYQDAFLASKNGEVAKAIFKM